MTVPPDSTAGHEAPALDTAFFRRWLDRSAAAVREQAGYLTGLDSAIGDADHGANMRRGFDSAGDAVAAARPGTPGALLKAFGNHLTSTVGGASGPLYGTVLRRAAKALGEEAVVTPRALGEALAAAVAGVRRLGDSRPGDKTMVDALAPAAEAYAAALDGGAGLVDALSAAALAARDGAEATIPMRARRGRASYLGERSTGHQDPGATSAALLVTALYETADPASAPASPAAPGRAGRDTEALITGSAPQAGTERPAREEAGAGPGAGAAAGGPPHQVPSAEVSQEESATHPEEVGGGTSFGGPVPTPEMVGGPAEAGPRRPAPGAGPGARVGVVLVSHSREVAEATAGLARALVGAGGPAPVAAAGGAEDGGIGTSAALIRRAVAEVDAGRGVVVLCDMGSAVLTVKSLLAETGGQALPEDVRIADAPFVEGAVAALVTASAGADPAMVLSAADDARGYRKL